MSFQPLVSVLINNFNYARFLADAIESALNQTYPAVEIIVVDDGSTDESAAVIRGFGTRVVPVLQRNGGQGAALNAGARIARGELLALLDADDYFVPDKIERIVREFQDRPDAVLFCHAAQTVSARGEEQGEPWPARLEEGRVEAVLRASGGWYPWPPTSCLVLNRRLAQPVFPVPPDEFAICADSYICDVAAFLGPIRYIPAALSCYRLHGGNAWSSQATLPRDGARAERAVAAYRVKNRALNRFLDRTGSPPVALDRSFMYQRAAWELSGCRTGDLPRLLGQALAYPAFHRVQRIRAALGVTRSWLYRRFAEARTGTPS
jgi:glycosyltransferase involved in cell wall biosynthesis